MKTIVEYLQRKDIIFKSLREITPKDLGSRKKLQLYVGVNLKGYYALVISIEKKSRLLRKEVEEFLTLHQKAESFIDSKITKKYILIKAPLCSHAKKMLEENGWRVWNDL